MARSRSRRGSAQTRWPPRTRRRRATGCSLPVERGNGVSTVSATAAASLTPGAWWPEGRWVRKASCAVSLSSGARSLPWEGRGLPRRAWAGLPPSGEKLPCPCSIRKSILGTGLDAGTAGEPFRCSTLALPNPCLP
eukprot:scaffold5808_cov128-Isochrysis_galbana.AAC.4